MHSSRTFSLWDEGARCTVRKLSPAPVTKPPSKSGFCPVGVDALACISRGWRWARFPTTKHARNARLADSTEAYYFFVVPSFIVSNCCSALRLDLFRARARERQGADLAQPRVWTSVAAAWIACFVAPKGSLDFDGCRGQVLFRVLRIAFTVSQAPRDIRRYRVPFPFVFRGRFRHEEGGEHHAAANVEDQQPAGRRGAVSVTVCARLRMS